ncbi:hypothetical protein SLE2022_288080 [Rubroshorea leprosula]
MVAAITILTNSFSSSSSSRISFPSHEFLGPPKVASSISWQRTSFCVGWFPSFQLNTTSRIALRPVLGVLSFQAARRLLGRCSCVDTNTHIQTDDLFSFFREIGLNDEETNLLLAKNSTLRSTSLDRIRSQVLALQSVGIKGIALFRLITKCPDVLIAEEIGMLISFLNNDLQVEIDSTQLERFFRGVEPRFLLGFDQKVKLLLHHGIPPQKIAYVLNNVNLNKAFSIKSVEDIERTITFLKPYGGTDIIVRRPAILNYDLDAHLIPKVQFLRELSGEDEEATGIVLRKLPFILSYRLEHMEGHVEFFRSNAGLSDQEVFKIIQVFPNMMSASKDRKLRPRTEFLKQCGLNSNDIFKFLTRAPLFLALSEENISLKIGYLVKIGYKYRTKELAVALGAVTRTSCENMQKVVGLFLSYGFSCADILAMSKKHPQVLQYNPSSLEEKMEYLIEEMGREITELLAFPAFLGYKLDDRIKHRFELKKKTRGEGMSLNKLLTVPADRFLSKKVVRVK